MVGGNTMIGVGITMYLRDEFTPNSRKISASNKNLHQSLRAETERTMRQQKNMYAGLAMSGVMGLRGIEKMVRAGSEFGYVMTGVGTIVAKNEKQLEALSSKAKEVGVQSIFTSKEVGEGMRFMAMAGMKYKEVLDNIRPATDLAAATMSSLGGKGGAADIMTNVMRGFNMEAGRSTEMADKLAYASLNSNTNLMDLGDALKYSAATAKDLNYEMEDVTAAIMTMGNAGIQGSMAGTAVENMMRYMTIASGKYGSKKQVQALKDLGLTGSDLRDSAGNMKSMYSILKLMDRQLQSMGTGQRQDVLQKIFGVRGKRAGSTLLRSLDTEGGFSQNKAGLLGKSAGYAAEKSEALVNSLKGQFLVLTNQWENFRIAFTESVEPVFKALIKGLGWILEKLSALMSHPVGKWIPRIVTGFIAIQTVLLGIRSAISFLAIATIKGTRANQILFSQGIFGWKKMIFSVSAYKAKLMETIALQNGVMGGAASQVGYFSGTRAVKGASLPLEANSNHMVH